MIGFLLALVAFLLGLHGPAPASHVHGGTVAPAAVATGAADHDGPMSPQRGARAYPSATPVPRAASPAAPAGHTVAPPSCPAGLLPLVDGARVSCVPPADPGPVGAPPGATVIGPGETARNAGAGD